MIYWIANILIATSSILDLVAVYRQIKKTLKSGNSKDVSTGFYATKLLKDIVLAIGLIIYANWAGFISLVPGSIAYLIAYRIVITRKPSTWKPTKLERFIGGTWY